MVLCYHALSPAWTADLSVTPDAFERQVTTLARSGWSSATFTEVVCRRPQTRTVAITFDDAFVSVREYALPVLRRLGMTATVFVPTDYVTRRSPLVWKGLDHWSQTPFASELTPMSWEDLGDLAEQGWEIGSHTRTHPHLTALDDLALVNELEGSRVDCSERLERPVTSLAYPYGDVDDHVSGCARAAGYDAAAALEWPSVRSGPHRHPRIGVYHTDSQTRFRVKIGGWSRSRLGSRLLARG